MFARTALLTTLVSASLAWTSLALPAQDPVPAAMEKAAQQTAAPAIPADVDAAVAIDVDDFAEQIAEQPAALLTPLLAGWMKLVKSQEQAVAAAEAAAEGSEERGKLEARRSDRDALIARARVVIDRLVTAGGSEAAVEQARADIASIQTQEQEKALQTGTLPQDAAKARELDTEVLKAQLRPLNQAQVEEELVKWMELLQRKALEVRNIEVAGLSATESADIERYNEGAVALRTERDALIKRVQVVVDALEAKQGDVAEAQAYLDSLVVAPPVTGITAAWTTFRAWLLSSEGGIALGTSILFFLGILFAFKILSGFLGRVIDRAFRTVGKTSDLLRSFISNSVRKVTMFIGLVIALSQLGVNIGPLLAAIGAAGFVIGFALQGTLSNFAAGVMIMLYRPYDIGDAVSAAGVTGKVDGMNLVSTSVKTFDNQTIVVPNGMIWGDVITNITANATRRVDMVFGIGYGDDIGKAEKVLRDVVEAHDKVLADPTPVIQVSELADSSVNFVVRPWAKTADYWDVYWDLTRTVKERFDHEGISIPFPQRDVHVHQIGAPTADVG